MKKAFYISGSNGSVMQVWDSSGLIHDLDSVSERGDVDVIHQYQDNEWDALDWQTEPYASDLSLAELEEYVGA